MWAIFTLCTVIIATSVLVTQGQPTAQDNLGIYLIDSGAKTTGLSKLRSRRLKAKSRLLFSGEDIRWYNRDSHNFYLDNYFVTKKIREDKAALIGKTFGVFVGDELIYTGKFWISLSSQSYSGPIINITDTKRDFFPLSIELGYPTSEYFKRTDQRSDDRIIGALMKSNRLYENLDVLVRCISIRGSGKRLPSSYYTFEVIKVVKGKFSTNEIVLELVWGREIGQKMYKVLDEDRRSRSSEEGLQFNKEKRIILNLQRQVGNTSHDPDLMILDVKPEK